MSVTDISRCAPHPGNLRRGVRSTEGDRLPVTDFRWPVRVYYEDTDSGGVVYYANYLRFMERARTEWMRQLGFEQDALIRDKGILFAVRSASLDYLRPARFNDLLEVSVRLCLPGCGVFPIHAHPRIYFEGDSACRLTCHFFT
jgi:hypothetical protein